MVTAGGNDDQLDSFVPAVPPARDPSLRDVLAQLDRIETQVGALNEQVGALNARMDELTLKVKRVTS